MYRINAINSHVNRLRESKDIVDLLGFYEDDKYYYFGSISRFHQIVKVNSLLLPTNEMNPRISNFINIMTQGDETTLVEIPVTQWHSLLSSISKAVTKARVEFTPNQVTISKADTHSGNADFNNLTISQLQGLSSAVVEINFQYLVQALMFYKQLKVPNVRVSIRGQMLFLEGDGVKTCIVTRVRD